MFKCFFFKKLYEFAYKPCLHSLTAAQRSIDDLFGFKEKKQWCWLMNLHMVCLKAYQRHHMDI